MKLNGLAACSLLAAPIGAIAATTPTVTVLQTYNGNNASHPQAGFVMDAAGNLYGTASQGGLNDGSIFELSAGTHAYTTLATFNGSNGSTPEATLTLDAGGNLYGTTYYGGSKNDGVAFELAAGASSPTVLATFNSANGTGPLSNLIADGAGNLYGTTVSAAAPSGGTIYKIAAGATTPTTLVNFNSLNGYGPQGGLIADGQGNLYGTTKYGGLNAVGSVFKFSTSTGVLTTLASFSTAAGGDYPETGLVADAAGDLFGTTSSYGATATIFEIAAGTGTVTQLATLGGNPGGSLLLDAAGDLFGTVTGGYPSQYGSLFELKAGAMAITTVTSFNQTNGWEPFGNLVSDAAGNLYGSTEFGGANDDGTLYELTGSDFVVATPEPTSFLLTAVGAPSLLSGRGRPRRRRIRTRPK